jgi:mono/diheme cytochrome c family protein
MQPVKPFALIVPLALVLALAACLPGGQTETAEAIPTGAEDFQSYCATCHGTGGKGDGETAG